VRRARKLTPPKPNSNTGIRDHGSIAESLGNILSDTTARIEVVTDIVNEANAELSDLYIVKEGVERALRMPANEAAVSPGATWRFVVPAAK
jgi:hypothetical protein